MTARMLVSHNYEPESLAEELRAKIRLVAHAWQFVKLRMPGKELLKNIVSTLDPKKAKRLLEKASKMNQGVDKISLKDLQGLLSQDSSGSEEETLPTKETRKNR